MKNLLFILNISFLVLFSCSSGDDSPKNEDYSLIGKWNLVSDISQYANNYTEGITTCQLGFWQFEFKNSEDMVFRYTSDDPSLNIGECDPQLFDYTYTINTDYFNYQQKEKKSLYLVPVNSGYSEIRLFIDSLSDTHLILHDEMNENGYYRKLIFKK